MRDTKGQTVPEPTRPTNKAFSWLRGDKARSTSPRVPKGFDQEKFNEELTKAEERREAAALRAAARAEDRRLSEARRQEALGVRGRNRERVRGVLNTPTKKRTLRDKRGKQGFGLSRMGLYR